MILVYYLISDKLIVIFHKFFSSFLNVLISLVSSLIIAKANIPTKIPPNPNRSNVYASFLIAKAINEIVTTMYMVNFINAYNKDVFNIFGGTSLAFILEFHHFLLVKLESKETSLS